MAMGKISCGEYKEMIIAEQNAKDVIASPEATGEQLVYCEKALDLFARINNLIEDGTVVIEHQECCATESNTNEQ